MTHGIEEDVYVLQQLLLSLLMTHGIEEDVCIAAIISSNLSLHLKNNLTKSETGQLNDHCCKFLLFSRRSWLNWNLVGCQGLNFFFKKLKL